MRDELRQLMLNTITKLKRKGLSEKDATDQVLGLVDLNRDVVSDLSYMRTILNNLVEIS
jgi:hypothetical protein